MSELKKVEGYLVKIFGKKPLEIREGMSSDSFELYLGGEFFGTVYKDTEDGETSYNITISILETDL
ncbi:MAG: DUF3126 family protein [Alphaproteobacteria bacterium]